MTELVITRRGSAPPTIFPSTLRLTPNSFGAQSSEHVVSGRIRVPRGWTIESPAPLAWFAHPVLEEMTLDRPAVFTLELEFADGSTSTWARSFNVRLDLRTTFSLEKHAFPERNSARVIGDVSPGDEQFRDTFRLVPGALGRTLFNGLYADIVQLRAEGEHRGGLCSGMARWAGLRALRGEDAMPSKDRALLEIITLHGRQLKDRAILSSFRWFIKGSPRAAYFAVRDDALSTGQSLRALDIGVPRPWRRDIARAVVREGHTIVPFHIRQESPARAFIDCYDPNRAREVHTIELHLDTNRYQYRNMVTLDDGGVGMVAVPHEVYAEKGTAFIATAGSLLWRVISKRISAKS